MTRQLLSQVRYLRRRTEHICLHRNLCTNVHSSPKVGTSHVSIKRARKQSVAHPCRGISLSRSKQRVTFMLLRRWTVKTRYCVREATHYVVPLYEMSRTGKYVEAETDEGLRAEGVESDCKCPRIR